MKDFGIQSHFERRHKVSICKDGLEKSIGKNVELNSYHEQGLTRRELSPQLDYFSKSGELLEGIYHPWLPIFGVQWHPERECTEKGRNANKEIMKKFGFLS